MHIRKISRILFIFALIGVFLSGIGVRRVILNAQSAPGWSELPFTLESALHYRLIERLVEGKGVPDVDLYVQYPQGVSTRETYTLSDEYLFAWLARAMPNLGTLTYRLRWISVVWFCLGIPLLAVWLAGLTGNKWAGLLGAAFYAVMLSSVIRSTGQELSRENFALPLLLAHLAAANCGLRDRCKPEGVLRGLVSGVCLGLALNSWDMIQYFVGILWIVESFRLLTRCGHPARPRDRRVLMEVVMTLAITLMSPYHRAHGFPVSPLFWLGIGLVFAFAYSSFLVRRSDTDSGPAGSRRMVTMAAILFLPAVLALLLNSVYIEQYNHFGELLWAKIRFLNRKPSDPSMLSFYARIMWVPSLHSASSKIVFSLFPHILLLTTPLFLLLCFKLLRKERSDPDLVNLAIFTLVTFIAFILFVRFHVYLAIFIVGILACGVADLMKKHMVLRLVVAVVVFFTFMGEVLHAVGTPDRWGRPLVYYSDLKGLVDWLRDNVDQEPVLANFGPSAMMLTYAGTPIVLHPKFESTEIRSRVEEYGNLLFKGDEEQLRDWMLGYDTRLVVYAKGEFAELKTEWQMRYFVDALNPPATAPARLFEFDPEKLKWFDLLWENTKYRVFRLREITRAAESELLAREALEALQRGELRKAEDKAARALHLDPEHSEAARILRHAASLLDRGFRSGQ